jgi:hypothetical protein
VALHPLDLERGDDHVAVAVPLDVEERIRDRDRDLVTKLRGAEGVGEDEDVRHGGGDATEAPART